MEATVEISMYPLSEDYAQQVTDFILELRKAPGLEVVTNGVSTQVFGEYETIMKALQTTMGQTLEQHRAMFVLKIGKGTLKAEALPEELK